MKLPIAAFLVAALWLATGSAEAGWFGGKKKPPEAQHLIMASKESGSTTMKIGPHPKKYDKWSWGRNKKVLKLREPTLHPYVRGY